MLKGAEGKRGVNGGTGQRAGTVGASLIAAGTKALTVWLVVAIPANLAMITLVSVLAALPHQSDANIGGLILALLILLALSIGLPVVRHHMARREHNLEQVDRLLIKGSARHLPKLSQVSDDELGATPTRYTMAGQAPYVSRPGPDSKIRELLSSSSPHIHLWLSGAILGQVNRGL
jgi:hypothetical protein